MTAGVAGLVAGLVVLTLAADRLVVSAARLSAAAGLSPVLIGAVVIGFGTSTPEFVVSVIAGDLDRAMGNVVGSNVSNLTMVLGTAVLVVPFAVHARILRREGVVTLGAVALLALVLAGGRVSRWQGVVLLVALVAAYYAVVRWAAVAATPSSGGPGPFPPVRESVIGVAMLISTIGGAWLLVWGARRIADEAGLTNAFVGLIILAVGTSLPELATSLAAARRRQTEMIIGNVLGSNLFNSLAVAGVVGLVYPGQTAPGFGPVLWLMVASAAVAGLLALTGRRLVRWEGALLLAGFVVLVVLAS